MYTVLSIKSDLDDLAQWARLIAADQVDFATALTLTMTGQEAKAEMEREMPVVFERPTPYTMRGLRLYPARKDRLTATVEFREDSRNYLGAEVYGGTRNATGVEKSLRAAGHLPVGWSIVPGDGARLDQYGNVDRGQLVQILSQLRITMTAGYTRNMAFDARKQISAQKRAGGRFFAVKPGAGRLAPGVYQREFLGRNITPVLIFVRSVSYRVRFPIREIGERVIADRLRPNFAIAWRRALASARGVKR